MTAPNEPNVPVQDQQPPVPNPPAPKRKRTLRRLIVSFLCIVIGMLALLALTLFALAGSNSGSAWLLNTIGAHQHLVSYQYIRGNLQTGVTLEHVKVDLVHTEISATRVVTSLGWRSILAGQVHLSRATIDNLVIHSKTAPTGKPFTYSPIVLPVVLRINEGVVNGMTISQMVHDPKTQALIPRVNVVFSKLVIRDALWRDDLLSLSNSSIQDGTFIAEKISGTMQFKEHYPIRLDGLLSIFLLQHEGFPAIKTKVTGDLEEIHGVLTAKTKDPFAGTLVVRPMDHILDIHGQVHWSDFHWPITPAQNFYSKAGQALITSSQHGLHIDLKTDFAGSNVPAGQYDVKLFTDYKGLDIPSFKAKIAQGVASGFGRLDWHGDLRWFVQGELDGVKVAQLIPPSVQPYSQYLPVTLKGPFRHSAVMTHKVSEIGVRLTGDSGEQWIVGLGRAGLISDSHLPLAVEARWQDLKRTLPGVGPINSQRGTAKIHLPPTGMLADIETDLIPAQAPGAVALPAGHYVASLQTQPTGLKIPVVTFKGEAGSFGGSANIEYAHAATKKVPAKPMSWSAALATQGIDLTTIVNGPIQHLQGTLTASGVSTPALQTISFQPMLTGLLKQGAPVAPAGTTKPSPKSVARSIRLTGKGQAVLVMSTAKDTSGLKAYSAKFDGDLRATDAPSGILNITVSGTPELTKIERFEHNGAAGQISARGQVVTKDGLKWQATGKLNQFNLGFFLPAYPSALSGAFNTAGEWDAAQHTIQISQLDLSGTLKGQALVAKGTLDAVFNPKSISLLPEHLTANNLLLDWAGNRVTANGGAAKTATGAPVGNININVDVKNLTVFSAGISGRIYGTIDLSGQDQAPDAHINLLVEQLKSPSLMIKNASLIGTVPQLGTAPGTLTLQINNLTQGKQVLTSLTAKLTGTQQAHVLSIAAKTPGTQVGVQFAGGLNAAMDWTGQLRQGQVTTQQLSLHQDQPAALQYLNQTRTVTLAAHCWSGAGRLCLTEPLSAGLAAGHVALSLDALDLGQFRDVMPSGMVWTGKLQGQATASWQAHQPPQVNAQLYTDNGTIGLAAEDPQDPPSTLPYQRLSLMLVTQSDGIKLRFDAKTPNIGTGYIDALIDARSDSKTINGALVLNDVQLQVFKPFLPGMRELSGVASLAGGMSGPLTNPAFYGEFKLDNGKVVANSLPLNLRNINVTSSIRGTEASINGQFMSGDGNGTLTGKAEWVDKPAINLRLEGKELVIHQPPTMMAWISPALDIEILPADKIVNLKGRVDIPRATITPNTNGNNAISKSADVRIVNLDQNANLVLKNVQPWLINADIDIALGNAVFFRGFNANARLIGGLHLRQRGQEGMTGEGVISMEKNAKLNIYGQALTFSKSNITFTGPLLQPKLDIEAFKLIDNVTVSIEIKGTIANLKIATRNNGGLTEQEAYSALFSGHIDRNNNSSINSSSNARNQVNGALVGAGLNGALYGTQGFTNQIGNAFGLQSLAFGAEGTSTDTQVNVTGYLTPDLYIRYGVGVFTPVNKLTLRYQVSQRFYMEASSSLDRAIDFFYNWRF
jgi:translocation and assembly module TamB